MLAGTGLLPWFTVLGLDIHGFRGDLGDTGGWIIGIPVGWLLLVAGVLLFAAGLALALGTETRYRRPAALVALAVPIIAAVGIVAERFKIHQAFDDSMRKSGTDDFSRAFAANFKLGDGIGMWIGLGVCLLAAGVALWALMILSKQSGSRPAASTPSAT